MINDEGFSDEGLVDNLVVWLKMGMTLTLTLTLTNFELKIRKEER